MPMKFEGCCKLLFEFSKNGVWAKSGQVGGGGGWRNIKNDNVIVMWFLVFISCHQVLNKTFHNLMVKFHHNYESMTTLNICVTICCWGCQLSFHMLKYYKLIQCTLPHPNIDLPINYHKSYMFNQLCFYLIIVFFSILEECEPNHNLLFKEGLGWKPNLGFGRFENHHWSHIWKIVIFKKHAIPIIIPKYQYQLYLKFRVYNPLSSFLTFNITFVIFAFLPLYFTLFPIFPIDLSTSSTYFPLLLSSSFLLFP